MRAGVPKPLEPHDSSHETTKGNAISEMEKEKEEGGGSSSNTWLSGILKGNENVPNAVIPSWDKLIYHPDNERMLLYIDDGK